MATNRGQIAADIHKRMVNDDRFGYSWEERWGNKPEKWTVDGVTFDMPVGDYDCSSSSIQAWRKALTGSKYAKALDAATYTGNMRSVFVGSGLFEWKPISFIASPGDLYLNEANHVAICQQQVPDELSEFSWGDNGAYGNKRGDQTGREAAVNPFYDYPWDGILHYNGKADDVSPQPAPAPSSKSRLNGIDIASWQAGINIANVEGDFVIIKVSGGDNYVNPYWKQWAEETLKAGKLLGLYHFACEYSEEPGGKTEAEFFLKQCKQYAGMAIFLLDWEEHATSVNPSYAKAFLDRVAEVTESTPLFYSYTSYLENTNLSSIAAKYPLWAAGYPYKYMDGSGYVDNPDMIGGTGSWKSATIYQYSSTRIIKGYGSRLDCNVFYGGAADWAALAGGKAPAPQPTPTPTPKNPVHYRSSTDKSGKKWLSTLTNINGEGYSGTFGKPMRWLAIDGVKRYRVCTEESGWLPWVKRFDIKDLDNGCAGDGSPINGVQVDDATCQYAVHIMRGKGKWYPDMHGLVDSGGSGDNFAGDLANRIDAIRMKRI